MSKKIAKIALQTTIDNQLTEREIIIVKHRLSGRTFQEIANILFKSKGEVSMIYYRAEKKIIRTIKQIVEVYNNGH